MLEHLNKVKNGGIEDAFIVRYKFGKRYKNTVSFTTKLKLNQIQSYRYSGDDLIYTIQIGAYNNDTFGINDAEFLNDLFYVLDSKGRARVFYKKISSRSEIQSIKQKLINLGYSDCFIVEIINGVFQ